LNTPTSVTKSAPNFCSEYVIAKGNCLLLGSIPQQMVTDSATKISKDKKEMTVVDTGGGGHELTQDVNDIKIVRMSDAEIDKTVSRRGSSRQVWMWPLSQESN
jgi:hypothetical protein